MDGSQLQTEPAQLSTSLIGRQAWREERRVSVKMLGPNSIADLGVSSEHRVGRCGPKRSKVSQQWRAAGSEAGLRVGLRAQLEREPGINSWVILAKPL